MKITTYFSLTLALLVSFTSAVKSAQVPMPQIDQQQLAQMFNGMYDLLMPSYKELYKKYYNEIEWVEHNYVNDRKKGDKILDKFANEFIKMMDEIMDPFIDEALKGAMETFKENEMPKEAFAQMKGELKKVMMQILPTTILEGMKRNAELKSSVYQEILKEKKSKK